VRLINSLPIMPAPRSATLTGLSKIMSSSPRLQMDLRAYSRALSGRRFGQVKSNSFVILKKVAWEDFKKD